MTMIKNDTDNTLFIDSIIKKYTEKKDYSSIKNISIDIETKVRTYSLIRLRDEQYYLLCKNSIAIDDNYFYLICSSTDNTTIYSSFPKMYMALKSLFGESGNEYDHWKGAFAFPFLIYFNNDEEEFCYLMNICNFRSSIEFRIRKLIQADDNQFKKGIYHEPFPEFSKMEIAWFINYIIGFLTGYFKAISKDYNEPFLKKIASENIIFGYKDGEFFEEYDTDREENHD